MLRLERIAATMRENLGISANPQKIIMIRAALRALVTDVFEI